MFRILYSGYVISNVHSLDLGAFPRRWDKAHINGMGAMPHVGLLLCQLSKGKFSYGAVSNP